MVATAGDIERVTREVAGPRSPGVRAVVVTTAHLPSACGPLPQSFSARKARRPLRGAYARLMRASGTIVTTAHLPAACGPLPQPRPNAERSPRYARAYARSMR